MKRCPTCNQTFFDEWLTFCTNDGSPLVVDEPSPPATLVMPPATATSAINQPTVASTASSPIQPAAWQPPPPPLIPVRPSQSLAVSSLTLGLISITLGWCCSFGLVSAPVAIVLGIYSLTQIKSQPERYGGKPLAIAGIVMGVLYFVAIAVMVIIYGLGILLSGASNF